MPAHPARRSARKFRNRSIHIERLEDRRMLAIGADLLKNIYADAVDANPGPFVEVNGTAFFAATSATTGRELWKTNGTAAGTVIVANIRPGADSSGPGNLVNVGGTLFFTATDGTSGAELWKSDGTAGGTQRVADITPGANGSNPTFLTNVDGLLYFSAADGTNGNELWQSDGTIGGTFMVRDIFAGGSSSSPIFLTNVNGTVFFAAITASGDELWKSDGTLDGTVLVKDISPAAGSSSPGGLVNVAGTLFFSATEPTGGKELWKSNGTTSGTVRVANLATGANNSNPAELVEMNGQVFFRANDGVSGAELWKSNGTAAGTVRVEDVEGDPGNFSPYGMTNINGTLFFRAGPASTGSELWKSDGTAEGTLQVKQIRPGAASSTPASFTGIGNLVFFSANDGTNGNELWLTDGTAAGTTLVLDINTGSGDSLPQSLANIGGNLLFSATEPTNGRELWRVTGLPAVLDVSGNVDFTENLVSVTLDADAKVTAPPGTSFNGGQLTVTIATNADPDDIVFIYNAGTGAGQIGNSNGNVTFGGVVIGTFTGGAGAAPLAVTFNSSATLASIQALLRNIRFRTFTDNPTPGTHRIEFVLTNSEDTPSNTGIVFAKTIAVNDAPKVSFSGTSTFTENGDPLVLAPFASVSDPDSANLAGGKLRVTITTNANANDRLGIRSGAPAPGAINVSGANVRLNTTTIGTITSSGFGTTALEITLNSNATVAAAQALVRAITFRTVGDTPTTGQRAIRFVLSDGDGGTSDPATATKLVNIVAVNDLPALSLSGSIAYTRNAPAILLAAAAGVSDVDSPNFAGGRLHVRIGAGDSSANRLGIGGGFSVDANNNVIITSSGLIIGKRTSSGFGTTDLIVVFNSNATAFRVQQLVRAITFKTVGGSAGTRSVLFSVSDGDGGTSPTRTKTVNVS